MKNLSKISKIITTAGFFVLHTGFVNAADGVPEVSRDVRAKVAIGKLQVQRKQDGPVVCERHDMPLVCDRYPCEAQ